MAGFRVKRVATHICIDDVQILDAQDISANLVLGPLKNRARPWT